MGIAFLIQMDRLEMLCFSKSSCSGDFSFCLNECWEKLSHLSVCVCLYHPDLFLFLQLILCGCRQCFHCHSDVRALPLQVGCAVLHYYLFLCWRHVSLGRPGSVVEKRSGHKSKSFFDLHAFA